MLKGIKYWMKNDEKNIAIVQNEKIHEKQFKDLSSDTKILNWLNTEKTYWRSKTLDKLELFLGKEIQGDVIEIGAGTAWCSSLLSKKKGVQKVLAIEFDIFSIEHIMPKVFKALDADENKIQRVLGFYDDIKLEDNSIDYIFSMGALHHSQNLLLTYKELWRVLKPEGKVLISEPTYNNDLTLEDEFTWRETLKADGSKNKDNGDQKFRICQWEAYALEAGFEVYPFIFDNMGLHGKIKSFLIGNKIIKNKKCYDGFNKTVLYPFCSKKSWKETVKRMITFNPHVPDHDKLLLILEKPLKHNYKAISENVYKH